MKIYNSKTTDQYWPSFLCLRKEEEAWVEKFESILLREGYRRIYLRSGTGCWGIFSEDEDLLEDIEVNGDSLSLSSKEKVVWNLPFSFDEEPSVVLSRLRSSVIARKWKKVYVAHGNTFPWKEELRSAGGRWNGKNWIFSSLPSLSLPLVSFVENEIEG
jgi:hypothetical protein